MGFNQLHFYRANLQSAVLGSNSPGCRVAVFNLTSAQGKFSEDTSAIDWGQRQAHLCLKLNRCSFKTEQFSTSASARSRQRSRWKIEWGLAENANDFPDKLMCLCHAKRLGCTGKGEVSQS